MEFLSSADTLMLILSRDLLMIKRKDYMRLFQLAILLRAVAGVAKSLLNPGMVFLRMVLTVLPERISSVVSMSLMARLTNQSTIIEFEGIWWD